LNVWKILGNLETVVNPTFRRELDASKILGNQGMVVNPTFRPDNSRKHPNLK
jgi:hypothetical protein